LQERNVGAAVGVAVGAAIGAVVGAAVGRADGAPVGVATGELEGAAVGKLVQAPHVPGQILSTDGSPQLTTSASQPAGS
jgi:uncharacterized protein YcfJ